MKKMLIFSLALAFAVNASAQTNGAKKKKAVTKTAVRKASPKKNTQTVTLASADTSFAFGAAPFRLQIADPTINAMNQKASGAPSQLSNAAITGMPKGTYGFANGKLFLRTTTATSPGTGYGSGGVGTGTSLQGLGTGESSIGVNGKSPYAGPWLWGSKQPIYNLPVKADSAANR